MIGERETVGAIYGVKRAAYRQQVLGHFDREGLVARHVAIVGCCGAASTVQSGAGESRHYAGSLSSFASRSFWISRSNSN